MPCLDRQCIHVYSIYIQRIYNIYIYIDALMCIYVYLSLSLYCIKCVAVVLWNQSVQMLRGLWLLHRRNAGLHCRYRKALESIMNLIRSTQSQQKGVRTPVVLPAHRGVFKIALLAVISNLPPTCPCVFCRSAPHLCGAHVRSCAVQDNGDALFHSV